MSNVKFMKNVLKIVAISVMFVIALSSRSYADEPINFDNLNFDNIPESGSTTTTSNTTTSSTTSTTTSSTTTKNTTKSTSASKEKMPATGSNTEIVFAIAGVALVSAGIVLFRRQNIKLK